jgi:hypothetical protein
MTCSHISEKKQSHWQSHQGQNNPIKVDTPYLKDHWMKDVENMSSRNKCFFIQNKIHLWMKIVDKRGEVNFSQWMRKATMLLVDGTIRVLGLMHTLVKHTPQHEQMPMCDTIVLMKVE